MVEAILHIGDGKCGSTSIQASLGAAAEQLYAEGISYLPDRTTGNHFKLITVAGKSIRGDTEAARVDALENIRQMRELYTSDPPDYILLSAESFFPLEPAEVMALLRRLEVSISGVHIVGYVREPVSMYLSLNQQKLKASHTIYSPDQYRRNIAAPFERWANEKICRSVHVHVFSPAALAGGSVVSDFGATLSAITGRPIALPERRANVSLSAEQMVVLQRMRREFFADREDTPAPASNSLVAFFEAMNAGGLVGTRARASREAAQRIGSNNVAFVEQLRAIQPDLAMTVETAACTCARWPSGDVADVLERVDPAVVDALSDLVPLFVPALRQGADRRSLDALVRLEPASDTAREAYRQYLRREGCNVAAEALHDVLTV